MLNFLPNRDIDPLERDRAEELELNWKKKNSVNATKGNFFFRFFHTQVSSSVFRLARGFTLKPLI